MNKVKSVKEIKKLIDKVMLPGYSYKTNFSSAEFLIDINYGLIIAAQLIRYDDRMEYQFILNTQFLPSKEITYDEIKMVNRIIDILEDNRSFALSRLKKYTVDEYDKEMEERDRQSKMMLEALMNALEKRKNIVYKNIGDKLRNIEDNYV